MKLGSGVVRKRGPSPESSIKKSILEFLHIYALKSPMVFWAQESVGLYDPTKKIFRKKNSKFQKNGVSDIIVVKNYYDIPVVIFFEVKAPNGYQSKEQMEFEREIVAINGFYFLVKSIDDVVLALELVRKSVESKIDRVVALRVSKLPTNPFVC